MVLAGGMALGLLLAAGAGSRMGRPKALVVDEDGTSWVVRSTRALFCAGCAPVIVVLGAAVEEAIALLAPAFEEIVSRGPTTVRDPQLGPESRSGTSRLMTVVASDWAEGMSASLRDGLAAAAQTDARAACITLVDLPDVGPEVIRRVVETVGDRPDSLGRAAYRGKPGHPVVVGRDHWVPVSQGSSGDSGARDYLAANDAVLVECADLANGHDIDTPEIVR